jgi:enoyl-CoA hydratase
MGVSYDVDGRVAIITLDRADRRNAVDQATARALHEAARQFDIDNAVDVAVLTGAGGNFCAGADLKAMTDGTGGNRVAPAGDFGPMGPTRLQLKKPLIAAVEGFAVAGGLELALWACASLRKARFLACSADVLECRSLIWAPSACPA